jgi:NAD(P) transhydrogenase subunit alpha
MNVRELKEQIDALSKQLDTMKLDLDAAKESLHDVGMNAFQQIAELSVQHAVVTPDFFVNALTVLILAGFVGYYVIWNVTPALYAPLMSVSNAISSVMVVGAMIAAGTNGSPFASWMGFAAVTLASINFFGGWFISDRMLAMFKKKKKDNA